MQSPSPQNLESIFEERVQLHHALVLTNQKLKQAADQYSAASDELSNIDQQLMYLDSVLNYCCEHGVDASYARLMLSNSRPTADPANSIPQRLMARGSRGPTMDTRFDTTQPSRLHKLCDWITKKF